MALIYKKLLEVVKKYPNKIAIIQDDKKLKYSELLKIINYQINQLAAQIPKQKKTIAILTNDFFTTLINVFALSYLNRTIIPINKGFSRSQIQNLLVKMRVDFIITNTNFRFKSTPKIKCSFNLNHNYKQIQNQNLTIAKADNFKNITKFLITLTSGSTGNPKAIIFSEKTKINRFQQAVKLFTISHNDVILNASPFSHSLGQRLTFLPLLSGATLVLLDKFNAKNWFDQVHLHKVTFTIPVSTHLHVLAEKLTQLNSGSLRLIISSSSSINHTTKMRLINNKFFVFGEMYGASEIGTATLIIYKKDTAEFKSVGQPCPNVKVKIKKNKKSDYAEIGEIYIKSQYAAEGYLVNNKILKISDKYGFFHTGDCGFTDENKFLYFSGRLKDVLIVGGINVFPSDIEAVLAKNKKIIQICVIGIFDDVFGDLPIAIIKSDHDRVKVESELRNLAYSKLASFQRPFKYFFVDQFPCLSSGKIDKNQLQKMFANSLPKLGDKLLSARDSIDSN